MIPTSVGLFNASPYCLYYVHAPPSLSLSLLPCSCTCHTSKQAWSTYVTVNPCNGLTSLSLFHVSANPYIRLVSFIPFRTHLSSCHTSKRGPPTPVNPYNEHWRVLPLRARTLVGRRQTCCNPIHSTLSFIPFHTTIHPHPISPNPVHVTQASVDP